MKVLIIILAIIFIIVLLGLFPVNASVSYIDKKVFYQVKYLSFTIMSSEKKNSFTWLVKKSVKDEAKKQAVKEAENISDTKNSGEIKDDGKLVSKKRKTDLKSRFKSKFSGDKDSLIDKIVMVKDMIILSKKHIGWLLRHIGIKDIYINFIVADEDAYECAVKYGKISILVYNILGFISSFFSVSKKGISVGCRFNHDESIYDMSCRIAVRPIMAGSAFFGILFVFAVNTIKKNRADKLSHKREVKA